MGYWLTSFAGVTIPPNLGQPGSHDVGAGHMTNRPGMSGSGVVHHPMVALPGGYIYDPQGSVIGPRGAVDVTAAGILIAPAGGNCKAQLDTWLALLGVRGSLVRTGDDGTTASVTARLVQAEAVRKYVHRTHMPLSLIWTVTGLPWTGISRSFPMIDLGPNAADDDVSTTGADSAGSPYTFSWTNGGNVDQAALVFTITAGGASITALTVTNTTTGHAWSYTAAVVAGQSLVIDTAALKVQNNGADDYAHFTPPTGHENWFELAPGLNTITFAVTTTGTVTGSITWSDAWV